MRSAARNASRRCSQRAADVPRYYVIRNVNDAGLAWSNTFGWVDNDTYDVFSEAEKATLNLPIEGRWVELS